MKVYGVKVTTKGGKYVANDWVVENAMDAYKAVKKHNTKAELIFAVTDYGMTADAHGEGEILAFTLDGFRYGFRING